LTSTASHWSSRIEEGRLPGGTLENLVGHPIWIYCLDGMGNVSRSEPLRVARVIYVPPIPDLPGAQEVTSPRPRLSWFEYSADFDFTFTVDIIHLSKQDIATVVFHREGISPDSNAWSIDFDLQPTHPDTTALNEFYYWTITVEDEFGDRITSLENSFEVSDGD